MIRHGILETSRIRASGPTYPTSGLVARYLFNGDGNDSFTNGYHFDLTGATYTTGVQGDANGALVMAGNDKNNTTLAYRQIINNQNSFSFSCFIKTNQSDGIIWAADGKNSSPYKRVWFSLGGGQVAIERYNATTIGGGGMDCAADTNGLINDNQWHHLVGVYDNASGSYTTAWRVYVDTVATDIVTPTAVWQAKYNYTIGAVDANTTAVSLLGNMQNNRAGLNGGSLDFLYVYNRVLTEAEISQLYNGGSGV